MSVGELLRYSVSESDNNACDILFRYIGGVEVVDKYIRTLGITDFKIEATEEDMHEGFRYQYLLRQFGLWRSFARKPCSGIPDIKSF